MLAARPPSKNLGERCRWGAVHQAARKEKKVIHQATLQKPTCTFSMQIHTGLSLAFPTEWKGTESIVCNCCYTPLFFHLYSLSHLFKKRALNFLVAIFSPWFLVSSVITWHIFVCKHPTPCLSTWKWHKYYTEALVQMIVHKQIKIIIY